MAKRSKKKAKTRKTVAKRKTARAKTRVKAAAKKGIKKAVKKRKKARKAKPRTFGERVSSAFKTVTGTITDVGGLRKKFEQPGSDETE